MKTEGGGVMTAKKLRANIAEALSDITYKYEGLYGVIIPLGSGRFRMGYDEIDETFDDVDSLMNAPVFDGKTLSDIAAELTEVNLV